MTSLNKEQILGIFDTDGYVLIGIDNYAARGSQGKAFGLSIRYGLEQSYSKPDLMINFAKFFGGSSVLHNKDKMVFRIGHNSPIGVRIRSFLSTNKPRHPGRFNDYLLSEEILSLLNQRAQDTKQGLVTLIILAYNNTKNQQTVYRKHPITYWYNLINPSQAELTQGIANADLILKRIQGEVQQLENQLPTTKFPIDYVRGAHFGDGGFTVALTWKPDKGARLRCEPTWTISGENYAYCSAFKYTFGGGRVCLSGKNDYKFQYDGIEKCFKIFYVFTDTWLPAYKQAQFSRFAAAIELLLEQRHFTPNGIVELLDLVYDMSEKGTRKLTKQQYIDIGLAWLSNNNPRRKLKNR